MSLMSVMRDLGCLSFFMDHSVAQVVQGEVSQCMCVMTAYLYPSSTVQPPGGISTIKLADTSNYSQGFVQDGGGLGASSPGKFLKIVFRSAFFPILHTIYTVR